MVFIWSLLNGLVALLVFFLSVALASTGRLPAYVACIAHGHQNVQPVPSKGSSPSGEVAWQDAYMQWYCSSKGVVVGVRLDLGWGQMEYTVQEWEPRKGWKGEWWWKLAATSFPSCLPVLPQWYLHKIRLPLGDHSKLCPFWQWLVVEPQESPSMEPISHRTPGLGKKTESLSALSGVLRHLYLSLSNLLETIVWARFKDHQC